MNRPTTVQESFKNDFQVVHKSSITQHPKRLSSLDLDHLQQLQAGLLLVKDGCLVKDKKKKPTVKDAKLEAEAHTPFFVGGGPVFVLSTERLRSALEASGFTRRGGGHLKCQKKGQRASIGDFAQTVVAN